jgi:hypothetical protein
VAAERAVLIGYFLLLFSTSASTKCFSTLRVAQFEENKWGFCQNPHSTFAKTATINPKVGIPEHVCILATDINFFEDHSILTIVWSFWRSESTHGAPI